MRSYLPSGLLLIDKPAGITSFGVVRRVRRALGVKKAGHLGTLDPFATGLLPLALGEATKLAQFLLAESKTYLATLKLGVETDTQDLTGRVVATSDNLPEAEDIRRVALTFVGDLEQVPPLYSAVHHEGERLYRLARRGVAVQPAPRRVTVHRLEVRGVALPLATLELTCAKGTYVRTLAHDLGRSLGCGAHLVALTRLAVGPFRLEEALTLEEAENLENREGLPRGFIPLARCLPGLPAVPVDREQARRLGQGRALPCPEHSLADGDKVRVLLGETLVAVAEVRPNGGGRRLAPVRVFACQETSGRQ